MSPVNLLRTYPFEKRGSPLVRYVGTGGGFVVTYSTCDRPTLSAIRNYQSLVTHDYPGWMTLFRFNPDKKNCRLQVFPLGDIPRVAVNSYV